MDEFMFRAPLYICFLYTVYIGCERVAALDRRLYAVLSRVKAIERELANAQDSPRRGEDSSSIEPESGKPCLARCKSTIDPAPDDGSDGDADDPDDPDEAVQNDDLDARSDPGDEAATDGDTADEPIAEDNRSDDEDVEIVDK